MKTCTNCVLPENFTGIKFNDQGLCNHCQRFDQKKHKTAGNKERYQEKFLELINQLKQSPQSNQRSYDLIMAYSGGKDSTYTLKVIKEEYGLKVLAITLNHGFISRRALNNIEKVTQSLGVDHLMITPNQKVMCNAFRKSVSLNLYPMKALERASSICNTCMNLAKSVLLRSAIEMAVPLIAYGWSPGQAPVQSSVMKINLSMIKKTQSLLREILYQLIGDEMNSFILHERHYELMEHKLHCDEEKPLYYNIHPLAFLEYNEDKILVAIKKLGWEMPDDTDANSTNCLLNSFANQVHQEQYGFHPYAFEIASLVREGIMTRKEGLAKLSTPADQKLINCIKSQLELNHQVN